MKMTYETLNVTRDDRGVVFLELARPEKRNALSAQMIAELNEFATSCPTDDTVRAVVLSGQGDIFCAGGDLGWMHEQIKADRTQRMAEARKLAKMLQALNEIPAPMIGRVHGAAYGGGIGMCCICDVVVADDQAKFGLTETKLGIIPATISPYVVARMGEGNARQVFMNARIFDADDALRLNIISHKVAAQDMDQAIAYEIEPYLHTAPKAAAASKALVRTLGPRIDDAVIDATITCLADIWEGEEAEHGIGSFLKKTKPRWA
jgi:methylglutaconyl-CoA hydratase